MSLIVEIRINSGPPVALVTARRVEGSEESDALNTYKIEVYEHDGKQLRKTDETQLMHRYGDGALVLAARALQASV